MLFSNTVSIFGCIIFFLVLKYEICAPKKDVIKFSIHSITLNILFWVVFFLPDGFIPSFFYYMFYGMSVVMAGSTLLLGIHYHAKYEYENNRT